MSTNWPTTYTEFEIDNLNSGKQFSSGDGLRYEDVNIIVRNLLYLRGHAANQLDFRYDEDSGTLYYTLYDKLGNAVHMGSVVIPKGAVELVQNLSGNEEDKAPSVKAVNDGLNGKVDIRTNRGKWVYTTEEGVQAIRKIGTAPVSWNIPWFDENKNLKSSTPVADNDATPKKWVEDYTKAEDAKIKRELDVMRDFVYGSFVETDTQGFYNNPVYIPDDQHLLPFASLDMISTGFKPKPGAYKDIVEDLAYDYNTADATVTNISTNTIKISTANYLNNPIGIEARLTESILSGSRFMWRVSVVGGSYVTQDGSTLNAADVMTMQAVNKWLITNAEWEQPAVQFAIGVMNGPVKYNDLELKFEVMVEDYGAFDLVPIFAVEVGGETVYTIPQEIRNITYPVAGAPGNVESNVYGLAINEGIHNYLDFDAKQYVINCIYSVDEDGEMHVIGHEDVIDVSAYLTDDDGLINISGGASIYFVGEDGNSVGGVSPCQVTFLKDKGASIT